MDGMSHNNGLPEREPQNVAHGNVPAGCFSFTCIIVTPVQSV